MSKMVMTTYLSKPQNERNKTFWKARTFTKFINSERENFVIKHF